MSFVSNDSYILLPFNAYTLSYSLSLSLVLIFRKQPFSRLFHPLPWPFGYPLLLPAFFSPTSFQIKNRSPTLGFFHDLAFHRLYAAVFFPSFCVSVTMTEISGRSFESFKSLKEFTKKFEKSNSVQLFVYGSRTLECQRSFLTFC